MRASLEAKLKRTGARRASSFELPGWQRRSAAADRRLGASIRFTVISVLQESLD
jgi:hypothetical protein